MTAPKMTDTDRAATLVRMAINALRNAPRTGATSYYIRRALEDLENARHELGEIADYGEDYDLMTDRQAAAAYHYDEEVVEQEMMEDEANARS